MKDSLLKKRAPKLAEALERTGQKKNVAHRVAVAATTVGLILAAAAGLGIADYHWVFPRWIRLLGGTVLLGALGMGVLWLRREWDTFTGARKLALELERKNPDLGCVLSTAVEYADSKPGTTNPYEKVLLQRLMKAATKRSTEVAPDLKHELRRALPGVLGAAILGGILLAFVPDVHLAIKRVITPWEEIGYTLLDVAPGSLEWPRGEPIEVKAVFRGQVTALPKISWKTPSQPRRTAWMERRGPSDFSFTFPETEEDIDYTVTVARIEPIHHRIRQMPMPVIRKVDVRVLPPEYTGEPEVTGSSLSLSVLAGSRISLAFETEQKWSRILLLFSDGSELPMVQSRDNAWLANWFPAQTGTFRFAFTDEAGVTLVKPQAHPMVVIPDLPPTLTWQESPGKPVIYPADPLLLPILIGNDWGDVSARFLWKKAGDAPRASTLNLRKLSPREWMGDPVLQVPTEGVQPGELLLSWVEASDARHRTADSVARSSLRYFWVLDPPTPPPPAPAPDPEVEIVPAEGEPSEKVAVVVSPPERTLPRPWFDAVWGWHQEIASSRRNGYPGKREDLAAAGLALSRWLNLWQTELAQAGLPGDLQGDLRAGVEALSKACAELEAGRVSEAELASERLLAALARIGYAGQPDMIARATRAAEPQLIQLAAEEERKWRTLASRLSVRGKELAQEQSQLNQRMANAERIWNLANQLNRQLELTRELEKEAKELAGMNPLFSHQTIFPLSKAAGHFEAAADLAQAGEPGRAVKLATEAVAELMRFSNRSDEDMNPSRRAIVDAARDASSDPTEMVLRLYLRKVTGQEGFTDGSSSLDPSRDAAGSFEVRRVQEIEEMIPDQIVPES